ncbi:transposase [Mesorhizobium helmanticense]|uniref:transposase n=1 Tax=Mesorhizobium helmanticense TaxID=1776423 RepID=UPI0011B20C94|nr:transposase [Mesorhizobium helmanticense]
MADVEKKTKCYLTDEEWSRIQPGRGQDSAARGDGAARGLERDPLQARSRGGWRMLPKDFPPISVAVETPYGHAHELRQLAGTFPGLTAKQQAPIKALNAEYAKTRSRVRACQRTAGRC